MSAGGKVLVTGATGFVGAAVARALLERGESVVLLARKPRRAAMSRGSTPRW